MLARRPPVGVASRTLVQLLLLRRPRLPSPSTSSTFTQILDKLHLPRSRPRASEARALLLLEPTLPLLYDTRSKILGCGITMSTLTCQLTTLVIRWIMQIQKYLCTVPAVRRNVVSHNVAFR